MPDATLAERRSRLEDLLARLLAAVGLEASRPRLQQAVAEAEQRPEDDRLVHAARLLGVRLTPCPLPTARVVDLIDRGAPVVGWRDDYDDGLLLLDREGSRVRLAGATADAADRWVAGGDLPPARWFLAQPAMPFQPPGGGDGHGDDDHHPASHGPPPLRRLVGMLRPEGRDVWVVVLFALGVGILSLATPLTVDELITSVQGGVQMRSQVVVLSVVLLVCLGLAAGLRALSAYVVELIQQRFFVRVVGDLAYRLPRASLPAFDRQNGPELVNRFFDVLTVQKAGAVLLLDGVSVVIQAAVGLVILGFYHPFLLGFDLVLLAAMCFIIFVLGRGAVATSIDESFAKYGVAGWLEEMVRHPLTFKHGGGADYARDRADALTRRYLRARQTHFRILFRQLGFALALQAVASAALLGLGGWLVIPDETGRSALGVGQLVAAELIVVVIVGSLVKLGKSLESYYDLMAAVDKLGHLIDLPLERHSGEGHAGAGPASLRLRHVSYAYEDGHGHSRAVLDHLDATVPAGARVAVVGPSGSGKSTLAELLYGLREPTHGSIELDGVDLRDVRLDALREQVALVSSLEIFAGTLAENVAMGRPYVTLADVRAALAQVELLDEVRALPDGLHTRLVPGGSPLSLGQARRVLLARALLGRPRLLLLDETLDELDDRSQGLILDAVLAPGAPWTALVITHRDDVAARCDRRLELRRPDDEHEETP